MRGDTPPQGPFEIRRRPLQMRNRVHALEDVFEAPPPVWRRDKRHGERAGADEDMQDRGIQGVRVRVEARCAVSGFRDHARGERTHAVHDRLRDTRIQVRRDRPCDDRVQLRRRHRVREHRERLAAPSQRERLMISHCELQSCKRIPWQAGGLRIAGRSCSSISATATPIPKGSRLRSRRRRANPRISPLRDLRWTSQSKQLQP